MNHKAKIFGLSMMLLMLITLTQVSADAKVLNFEEQNKLVTLTYDSVTIKVNAGGMVPKFQYIEDNSDFEFNVMFKSLTEYLDFNEDGVFQYNETSIWKDDPNPPMPPQPNTLALSSIRWVFSGFDVDYKEGTDEVSAVHFNFTSDLIMEPFFSGFEIEIRAHMYLDNTVIDGYQVLGKTELKFDVAMNNYPFQRNDTNLAFRFDISPLKHTYQLNDTNGLACETKINTTSEELKVQNTEAIKQMYKISGEGVEGHFAYAKQARYNISNQYQYRTVNASYASQGDGTLQTYLSFEQFEDEIVYDPSIGTDDTVFKTGSLDLVFIGTGALMIVGLVLLRRRK